MTDQEFCVVTRKKWIARKSLKNRKSLHKTSSENALQGVDITKFLSRLQRCRERMESSDYFQLSLSTLSESLQQVGTEKIGQIVCFGIGPFTRSVQALHQFCFILELQRHLNVADAVYFDPVFRDGEKQVLKELQCTLMKENCEAKYPADSITIFYLPHCPNSLTNNLLWRNWTREMLTNVIVINNSFDSLTCSKPERLLRVDSQYILDVLPYTKEFVLEDCYETHNVFNDLSIHVFPSELLPEKHSAFWTVKEAPKYEPGEMITVDEFSKLAII